MFAVFASYLTRMGARFVGMNHFNDQEVKDDCVAVLTEMLPSLEDVSDALDEYKEYHSKNGRFSSPLLWIRAEKVSPAEFWLEEAPRVKWLNKIGAEVLSLAHSASGTERNWSTHGFICSNLLTRQITSTLERNVRTYRNMRLRDHAVARGVKAKKQGDPKAYPLEKGDWSSCDESSDGESSQDAVRATMGF